MRTVDAPFMVTALSRTTGLHLAAPFGAQILQQFSVQCSSHLDLDFRSYNFTDSLMDIICRMCQNNRESCLLSKSAKPAGLAKYLHLI